MVHGYVGTTISLSREVMRGHATPGKQGETFWWKFSSPFSEHMDTQFYRGLSIRRNTRGFVSFDEDVSYFGINSQLCRRSLIFAHIPFDAQSRCTMHVLLLLPPASSLQSFVIIMLMYPCYADADA